MLPLHINPERFSKTTRSRGDQYHAEGCVELVDFDNGTILAFVHGTLTYSVRVKLRETKEGASITSFSCTCPQFERADECKHVWATICTMRELPGGKSDAAENADAGTLGRRAGLSAFELEPDDTLFDGRLLPEYDPLPSQPFSTFDPRSGFSRIGPRLPAASAPADIPPVGSTPASPRSLSEFLGDAHDLMGDSTSAYSETRFLRNVTGELELIYWLDRSDPRQAVSIPLVDVMERQRLPRSWGKLRVLDLKGRTLDDFLVGEDRRLVETLMRLDPETVETFLYRWPGSCRLENLPLESHLGRATLIDLARTGRLFPAPVDPEEGVPVGFDSTPWEFSLTFVPAVEVTGSPANGSTPRKQSSSGDFTLVGQFHSGETIVPLVQVLGVFESGLIWFKDALAPLADLRALRWITLVARAALTVPASEIGATALRLLAFDPAAPLVIPDEVAVSIVRLPPRPRLVVQRKTVEGGRSVLFCNLFFDYGDGVVLEPDEGTGAVVRGSDVIARDLEAETECVSDLLWAGARRSVRDDTLDRITLTANRLPHLVEVLLPKGWSIEAEGQAYRSAGEFNIQVESGMDWLDVKGDATFDGETLSFPRLLGALRRGSRLVPLGDGSVGVLPQDWLRRAGALAAFGELDGDDVRFRPGQAWILDALLAGIPEVQVDEKFAKIRERIASFKGIAPLRERRSFRGKLRPYQREALGWLRFLRELGLGGCLADDMGLGKTVQVIAHLEGLRLDGALDKPTLVVAPRSVLENWLRELTRFAPRLKVIDASGPDRKNLLLQLDEYHVALTTYALVRSDITKLREQLFDTVILDEAQAIKNAQSQTAKAVRLLDARHRLALSGTPIENHIGELWSLFEFLQPGTLGRSSRFHALVSKLAGESEDTAGDGPAARGSRPSRSESQTDDTDAQPAVPKADLTIAGTVRPFILRRTKGQVAPDLPARTEQIIECPLGPRQRELYDEMLAHYRSTLLPPGSEKKRLGAGKSISPNPMLVMQALLRLRQAACHPGLLDRERGGEGSGKLDLLLERVEEIREEGHRCLIFSQFTQFLGIVRERFDARGITYEYLDGKTRNRQECVDRFQLEGASTAFLISLKAGGLGLNLTAADYVFLLDPWWNPAAEAQAIDRAHRIGRTKPVFAYRLIAPGTVEEKVLKLQNQKRELADAIIREDDGWLGKLTAEDLGQLFG